LNANGTGAVLLLCVAAAQAREPFKKLRDGRSPLLGKRSVVVDGYIVALHSTASLADLDDVIRACNCQNNPGFTKFTSALIGFAVDAIADADLHEVRLHPQVEYVEHNQEVNVAGTQAPAGSWGLDRIDQTDRPLSNSYTYNNGGEGVNVYVIDSGIRYSHADFGGRARFGADFVGGDGSDCLGHGTHVASTIGGAIHGVAKGTNLWSVRIFGCQDGSATSTLLAALDWVIRNRRSPAIINMSIGGFGTSARDAVQQATNNGVLSVIAAGNDGGDACGSAPGSAPSAITVAASDINDNRASFSNNGGCVDLYAPGVSITGASYASDNGELIYSGTSMAAPHVAGAAALFWAVYPFYGYDTVTNVILSQAARDKIVGNTAGTPNLLLNVQSIAPALIFSPLVFEVNWYKAANADLASMDNGAATSHWAQYGINEGRHAVPSFFIDEYRSIYGDLAPLSNADLVNHFMSNGYSEGREGRTLLHPYVFNVNYYLDHNADIPAALGYTRWAAVNHWINSGVYEGRQASASFNVNQYKALYGDLAPLTNVQATYHFVQYGVREGRRGTF